jgi:hypothetical protein
MKTDVCPGPAGEEGVSLRNRLVIPWQAKDQRGFFQRILGSARAMARRRFRFALVGQKRNDVKSFRLRQPVVTALTTSGKA